MKKIINLISICLLLLTVVGCGKPTLDELYSDAEYLYSAINEDWQDKDYLSDTDQEYANEFVDKYVEKYKTFNEEEQEIIMEMDKLIRSHQLYFVSTGIEGEDTNNYEEKIDDSLNVLADKLNK